MKWSSRLSADHSAVKDALIANLEDKGTNKRRTVDLTQDEVEQNLIFLAELEHRRFLVERLIEGWLPLATDGSHSSDGSASGLNYSKQKSLLRLNTTLVSYSHLPEAEQTKILPSIRALPKLIAWTAPSRP
jgi:hypothetical protein